MQKVQTYQGNEASSKPTSEPQRARVGAKGQAPSTHSAFRGWLNYIYAFYIMHWPWGTATTCVSRDN